MILTQSKKLFPPGPSTSPLRHLAKSFHNNLSSNVQLLNIDNNFSLIIGASINPVTNATGAIILLDGKQSMSRTSIKFFNLTFVNI